MGLYLYCLVPAGAEPPATLRGLEDAPVAARAAGRLACWVSPSTAVPDATLERIRRHDAVVEAALAAGLSPVPLRWGQWVADEAALAAALLEKQEAYLQALERVADAVEFGIRVLDPRLEPAPAPAVAGAGAGTEYMRALAARAAAERSVDARGQEIAANLRAVLGSIIRQERIDALPTRHGVVSLAHLVARGAEPEYRAGVERVRRARPELRFLVTGPWPAYSFGP